MKLKLEKKAQPDLSPHIAINKKSIAVMTPPIKKEYWSYRVPLSEKQAVVAFPKFGTIGIGFQQEEDWNTNLPHCCSAKDIFDHIAHNKADETISDNDCIKAIEMIQEEINKNLLLENPVLQIK
jgi:hypothetical protein